MFFTLIYFNFISQNKIESESLSPDLSWPGIRVRPDDFVDDRGCLCPFRFGTKGGKHLTSFILLILVIFAHNVRYPGSDCFTDPLDKVQGLRVTRLPDLLGKAFRDSMISTACEVKFLLRDRVIDDEFRHRLYVDQALITRIPPNGPQAGTVLDVLVPEI